MKKLISTLLMFISCARCVVVNIPALNGRNPASADVKYDDWRLPRALLPRQYKVRLLPFLNEGNFSTHGRVEILLECMQETDFVVIHMVDIVIVKDTLQISNLIEMRPVKVQSYVEDKQREFLLISTKNDTMQVGKFYQLSMDFVGQLNDKLNGFYRSSYTDNGVQKYLATTQFSPTDARRAFPCFDEPGMKAKFQITLGRETFRTSRSNMPLKRTTANEELPGYVWDEYETTLPMSTYILAFVVSELEGIDAASNSSSSVHFRIWSRPSAANQTEYARSLGPQVLSFLEGYFNVSFPLPKLDMFAIPDFAVGAMENWGLVTYRETSLLYDAVQSSAINQQRVASVIAHELAHQWFGNLVTMEWWSDLWLKEGFASFMEFVAVDAVDPRLQIGEQFTVEDTHSVFGVDALTTSHPMSVPVNKRNDINELFDSIPYSKGPAVIRMLSNFMREESFRRGLTLYLNTKKYANAVQDDLWEAMNEAAVADGLDLPADVQTIMNSWSLQTGYPVVTVQRNYDNQSAIITQERFFLLSERPSADNSSWWVPLTFTSDFGEIYTGWMFGDEEGMELDINATSQQWVIFNVNQVGYYRVNYDAANWNLLIEQLQTNHSRISSMSRAQLIDDSFDLARTGKVAYSTALELIKYLDKERHYVPWKSALDAMKYIDVMLYDTPSGKSLQEFLKLLLLPVLEEVGFDEGEDDPHLLILNRNQIIGAACRLSMPQCVENAASLYQKWMQDPDSNRISANLQRVVTCAGVANGGDDEWSFAYRRYQLTNVANEKETLLNAMSCSRNPELLDRFLHWSLDPTSGIRRQDARAVFANVANNPLGQSMVFDFLLDNWNQMVKSFPSLYVLGRIVDSVTLTLNTERDLTNLIELSKGDLGTASRSILQAIERTRINLEWMKRHNERVSPVSLSSLFGSSDPQLLLF